jgi:hypothetical protein
MWHYVMVAALSCLFRIPAGAQVPAGTMGQSIEGTWISEVADATGKLTLFEVGTFSPEGSYTGANVNGLHSTHKGVWVRTGHLNFVLTVLFSTHDAQGVFNGIVKAKIYLTLADDLQSYDSVAERIVMNTSGQVLSVTYPIRGHSVRMNVEFPDYPPPQ